MAHSSSSMLNNGIVSIVDPSLELTDPTPDIFDLFVEFNDRYFFGEVGCVTLKWSERMKTCAGLCVKRADKLEIRLSKPLLSYRSRKNLVETLLHEMIHAFLIVTNMRDKDPHGNNFKYHMQRINNLAGTNITIYHDYVDEVERLKQHWWRCDGPCKNWAPFFGYVKRTMNRKPGPSDAWYNDHAIRCNGTFIKIKEPPVTAAQKNKRCKTAVQSATKSDSTPTTSSSLNDQSLYPIFKKQ